jgi:hypothetical protein
MVKKVTWEELSSIEKRWAERWVEGICELEAKGPVEEPPEETRREFERCTALFYEDRDKLAERARRWSEGLRRVLE